MTAFDRTYNISVIGDCGVGKSTWLQRLTTGEYIESPHLDYYTEAFRLTFETNRGTIKFDVLEITGHHIWDLREGYHLGMDGGVIMYDVGNRLSCRNAFIRWLKEIYSVRCISEFPVVVVGNKIDISDRKVYPPTKVLNNSAYLEMSSKSSDGIKAPLLYLARILSGMADLEFK